MFLERQGLRCVPGEGMAWLGTEKHPSGGFRAGSGEPLWLWLNARVGLTERLLHKEEGFPVAKETIRCCRAGSYLGLSPPTKSFSRTIHVTV